ncbi:MAG: RidA family protein [Spirochaetales bacterium]|nr:RidA family protein [Spirochaetales bacterium]
MEKTVVATERAPKAIGPYSQAVKAGGLVFCSGQLGLDPASGDLVSGGVKPQAEQALRNLKAVLHAAGSSIEKVVKTTIFLADMADFATVNEVYGGVFTQPHPARSTFAVAGLPKAGLVEIEAIALA